jgi:hypothetical protein
MSPKSNGNGDDTAAIKGAIISVLAHPIIGILANTEPLTVVSNPSNILSAVNVPHAVYANRPTVIKRIDNLMILPIPKRWDIEYMKKFNADPNIDITIIVTLE